MATHRISGVFVAVMEEMDDTPVQSAEILMDLMCERFGYLKSFEVFVSEDRCNEEDQ